MFYFLFFFYGMFFFPFLLLFFSYEQEKEQYISTCIKPQKQIIPVCVSAPVCYIRPASCQAFLFITFHNYSCSLLRVCAFVLSDYFVYCVWHAQLFIVCPLFVQSPPLLVWCWSYCFIAIQSQDVCNKLGKAMQPERSMISIVHVVRTN